METAPFWPIGMSRRLAGAFSAGAVLDQDGTEIGRHPGTPFLTVGQRSGFEVRPRRPDAGEDRRQFSPRVLPQRRSA